MTTTTINDHPADAAAASLPHGVWSVAARHSEIAFAVKEMWGLRTVRGTFGTFKGGLVVRAGGAIGELAIEAASLATGHDKRDRHLRSPAFFDVDRHPWVVFTLKSVAVRDGRPAIGGELSIGDARVQLEIPVAVERRGDGTLGIEGGTTVSREAAGLAWNKLGMIRGDAILRARLTLEPEGS